MTPTDRRYASTHEWVKLDGDLAVVGITDHAQHALGDITFVDLPKPGLQVQAGKEFGAIESVKAASDLFAPVGGEVREVNAALSRTPELVNQDPYGAGWIVKFGGVSAAQLNALLDAEGYEKEIAEHA